MPPKEDEVHHAAAIPAAKRRKMGGLNSALDVAAFVGGRVETVAWAPDFTGEKEGKAGRRKTESRTFRVRLVKTGTLSSLYC